MGTGAVYVTLSGLKQHSDTLTHIETFFFFLNIALFLLNITTLLLQLVCEFWSHFVPVYVLTFLQPLHRSLIEGWFALYRLQCIRDRRFVSSKIL